MNRNGLGFLYSDDYGYYDEGMDAFGDLFVDPGYLGGGGSGWDYYEPIDYAPFDPAWPIDEPVADQAWFVGNDDLPTFDTDPWFAPIETVADQAWFAGNDEQISLADYDPSQAWPIEAPPFETDFVLRDTIEAPLPPERLPDISWPVTSYVPDQWALPPFVPVFEDFFVPPPPPAPQAPQLPNLPPACPQGQYHPYPIGHPQQDVCVPFPAPPRQSQQQPRQPQVSAPRPSGGQQPRTQQQQQQPTCPTYCKHPQTGQWYRTPSGYTCAPVTQACTPISQQQQQQCPPGYYRASNGQCLPIPQCTTPGTVFDQRTGRCVPFAQSQQPLCPSGYWPNPATRRCEPLPTCAPGLVFDVSRGLCVPPEGSSASEGDILSELKKVPWWAWAGLGALLLLNRDDQGGKKVTIQHRKAT